MHPTDITTTHRPPLHAASGSFNPAELPLVSTKHQLAAVLSCSCKHIENLTARGVLRPVRLGRCIRYRRDAILRALENLEGRK